MKSENGMLDLFAMHFQQHRKSQPSPFHPVRPRESFCHCQSPRTCMQPPSKLKSFLAHFALCASPFFTIREQNSSRTVGNLPPTIHVRLQTITEYTESNVQRPLQPQAHICCLLPQQIQNRRRLLPDGTLNSMQYKESRVKYVAESPQRTMAATSSRFSTPTFFFQSSNVLAI